MPLLQNKLNRRSEARATRPPTSSRRDARNADPTDLPSYEPLSCALSDEAKRALAALVNSRDNRRYEEHIKQSITHLGKNVAAINDRLSERQTEVSGLAQKRAEKGGEQSYREVQTETSVSRLAQTVDDLSAQSEEAMRDLVDRQNAVVDDKEAVTETVHHFQALPARRARRGRASAMDPGYNNEDDEEEQPPPEQSVIEILESSREAKAAAYEDMTPHQRYALNNDYAAFKKLWHDSTLGDREVPLPDPGRWFDRDGNPVVAKRCGGGAGGGGAAADGSGQDDSDEDLVIEGEVRSFKCPLSLQDITEPFTGRKCNHTFQKSAIIEWYGRARNIPKTCPQTGCSQSLAFKDFYDDAVVLRKIERAKKRREQEEAEEDDDDDEDVEGEVRQRPAPASSRRERKRAKVEPVDDDEEEE